MAIEEISNIADTNGNAPVTDLALSASEQAQYLDLLMAFYDAQDNNHGAEAQVNASLDALGMLDNFISAAADARGLPHQKPHIERVFNEQAADARLTIDDHLDSIEHKRVESLRAAQENGGVDGIMELLRKGGAQIIDSGVVLVRTNPERAHLENNGGDGGGEINVPEDKFARVIDLLLSADIGGQRIYMDDLVVQKGEFDKHMVRSRPYDVIQIPKISKEIAVCDLNGQAMFVSPQIHGPKLYAVMNKQELEHVMGITRVTSHAGWEDRMLDALGTDVPEAAQKIDVAKFAKTQKSAKMPLSPEIVGLALLKYAAMPEHNGEMASQRTTDTVPDMPGENWKRLDQAGFSGSRKMPVGMDFPAVKRYYGWYDAQSRVQKEKIAADVAHYQATGEMPKPVISIEEAVQTYKPADLSIEIVGLALLKYAAMPEHNGEMASDRTPDAVPDMPQETWKALSGENGSRKMPEGMNLAAVKRYYGWNDAQNRVQKEKIAADVARYQATSEMPKPAISIEEAVQAYKPKDLSPEIVAFANLKYAAAHDGTMAGKVTQDDVPDMPQETWNAMEKAGCRGGRKMPKDMTLSVVKAICGWQEEGVRKPAGAYKAQLETDIAYFNEHGQMSDDLKDRIARGVAAHVARLEAQQEQECEYNEPQGLEI